MVDVCIYLSSLARAHSHDTKVQMMLRFAEGAKKCGASVVEQKSKELIDCRLGLILGWFKPIGNGSFYQIRKNIVDYQLKHGNKVMSIDSNCFRFADPKNEWQRYSFDSVFYNKGFYANKNSSSVKWEKLSNALNIDLNEQRKNGNHILVCSQRNKTGWSAKGTNQEKWLIQTIKTLQGLTDRPIVVRPHPYETNSYKQADGLLKGIKNVTVSDSNIVTIQEDLKDAWCTVFYNSSSSVASILAGVPVFVSEESAVTWNVANHNLNDVENPKEVEPVQWLYDLAACHWNPEESRNGDIYKAFQPFLPA